MSLSSSHVVVPASGTQTATLIFLHGLGDTGRGWASSLAAIKPTYVKLICPTANSNPVSLNGGLRMPSWFDLKSLDPSEPEDESGIKTAAGIISNIIQSEISAGIPSKSIVLGGFSQGGALALYTGLSGSNELGGIIALSSWLPLYKTFSNWGKNKSTPILQCHGSSDPLVLYPFGLATSHLLKSHSKNFSFKMYEGVGHSSCDSEMEDLKQFISQVVPPA